eukprot:Skav218584  [mRNA]  locus=scaffold2610:589571:589960:- [translate_table: standard]
MGPKLLAVCLMLLMVQMPMAAKTDATAAFGKLMAAVAKCFGPVVGVNMNKFKHIWTAAHKLDKLDPVELVFDVVKTVNPGAKGLHAVYVTLRATGTVIKIVTKLSPAGAAQVGTAYVVSEVSDALLKTC